MIYFLKSARDVSWFAFYARQCSGVEIVRKTRTMLDIKNQSKVLKFSNRRRCQTRQQS